jgi:2-polyprenyl-6-methoxyphenol hydroxylase-like FAD-dependent oxidoreductase
LATPSLTIAICGAGPAGLATALYMQRLGHRPVVFERFDAPKPLGSGLILQPTGQAVLQDLGLLDAACALGTPLDRLYGADARTGRVVLDVRYAALPNAGRGLGMHRAALFDILYEAVLTAGITVNTGADVVDLTPLHNGQRRLIFANGAQSDGFDLVVDCLGANSSLRQHSHRQGLTQPMPFGAIWATLPWNGNGFDRGALNQRYRAARVMIGVLPVGRSVPNGPQQASFFWSLKPEEFAQLKSEGLAAWKARVLQHWPEVGPYLDHIDDFADMSLARYAHFTMPTPYGDGVVFVGDAAHSTSPQLGQGANMALLDARALYLGLRDHPADLPAALAHYAQLRRWHLRLYQCLSAAFTPFYQSDSRFLPFLRDIFVSALARIPPAPQILVAMVAGSLLSPVRKLELGKPPRI